MTKREDFHTVLGATMLEWRDGYCRAALDITPRLLNRSDILHGGVLLCLLDEVGALAGVWCSVKGHRRYAVTVDLNGHFTGQAKEGQLIATGEIVSHGRSLYFARSEIRDSGNRLISYGTSTHKWRRGSENVEGLPVAAS
jgi:uncharacterized protein (TIGR00369 family)